MTAVAITMLVVAAIVAVFDRRRRSGLDSDVCPWMIAEIEANVRGGHTLPVAVMGVALHGPPSLRRAANAARRVRRTSGDAIAALGELQHRVVDPRIDRLCEVAGAVHTFDGDVTAVLAHLRAAALDDARHDRELERARSALRFAAWVALLPVVAAAWGRLPAVAAALAVGAAAWAWTAVLVTGTRDARVFGMGR
jgi:Flp pilus assembly protein TadB